jgi:hypothetical protein
LENKLTFTIAKKTMEAIEASIAADQGSAYRVWLGKVIPHIGDAYRAADGDFRSHLGASGIGQECDRAIWYSFIWTTRPKFSGRMIRLFNRGHLEEARFIAILLSIGVQVFQQDENGKQFRISEYGGHFGGSGDGIAYGLPDIDPSTPALIEFKTHSEKSFSSVKANGVRESKFEHYVQMQVYMYKMRLPVAMYFAVNKNTDEIYAEVIALDTYIAETFVQRAITIIPLKIAPKKLNESAGFYKCKFCDHAPVCHKSKAPEKTCRSCVHSFPTEDGNWNCKMQNRVLSKDEQLAACSQYNVL